MNYATHDDYLYKLTEFRVKALTFVEFHIIV